MRPHPVVEALYVLDYLQRRLLAASALLTRSDMLPASQPGSRASSAYVHPRWTGRTGVRCRAPSGRTPHASSSRPTRARLSHSHFFHLKNASSAAMMTRLSAMTVAYPYSQLSSGMFEKFMPYHPVMVVMGTKMDATTVR